ncbi:hypothetical protein JHN59_04640 [Streptomyces sp. MBT49]|nr:hypothetical protein [Streptomyces sp. MBT49]
MEFARWAACAVCRAPAADRAAPSARDSAQCRAACIAAVATAVAAGALRSRASGRTAQNCASAINSTGRHGAGPSTIVW